MSDRANEEEYFHKRNEEAKARLRADLQAKGVAEDAATRQAMHANKCGKCGGNLKETPFRGIDIDVCQSCGAVLLDPGELQKIAQEDQGSFVGSFLGAFGLRK